MTTDAPPPQEPRDATPASGGAEATAQYTEAPTIDEKLPFPLQPNERLLLVCRRHWMYLWPRTVWYLLLALVPVAIAAWLLNIADAFDEGMVQTIFTIAVIVWLLFWAIRIYLNWYRYHNDTWTITSQRIIDSYKANPFSHNLSSADLVNVQDMTVERRGIFQTTLNYGDVVCQTAGSNSHTFRMTGVPKPQDVQLFVDRERDRERMRSR
jgi:hypothetical protein